MSSHYKLTLMLWKTLVIKTIHLQNDSIHTGCLISSYASLLSMICTVVCCHPPSTPSSLQILIFWVMNKTAFYPAYGSSISSQTTWLPPMRPHCAMYEKTTNIKIFTAMKTSTLMLFSFFLLWSPLPFKLLVNFCLLTPVLLNSGTKLLRTMIYSPYNSAPNHNW